ncbi:uncharacterized protein LOC132181669 [Corylus avellana]|uniref:uncharacterized protein LOC132181669 n=1 Tax=Corylus avellana TaxID=13451 RepID=UPI00286CE9D7|nr:uncharacterized protein LOC132181669 [Corylus avellana]
MERDPQLPSLLLEWQNCYLIRKAKEQVAAFNNATQRSISMVVAPPLNSSASWVPPPVGYVKINWDSSIKQSRNQMGVGVIVRDHTGKVLAIQCATKCSITHAPPAEAIGAWTAVNYARRMDYQNVVFEGDAMEIVRALNNEGNCWTTYGQIVNAAKAEIVQHTGWVVQYVSRLANRVAHRIAKAAFMYGEGREWKEDFPFNVQEPSPDNLLRLHT